YNSETGSGTITVSASGGTPPYQYRLDEGEWQSSDFFSSLEWGTYIAWVKDQNDCTDTLEVFLERTVYIPDTVFRAYLVNNFTINTNEDDEIQYSEAEAFTGRIQVVNSELSDLTGIEAFIHITELYCFNNSLTDLDVSNSPELITLLCWANALTSLDVSNNPVLTSLTCYENSLTSLDVTNCSALESLSCSKNLLTSLDVSNNPLLRFLTCTENAIATLDVLNNPALTSLTCYENSLTSVDVSNNPLLTTIRCQLNALTWADLRNGNNENITTIEFSGNLALSCVSVDDVAYAEANWAGNFDIGVTFSVDCNPVPDQEVITDQSFGLDETNCFNALQTITVGGDGNPVDFLSGSTTTLIAGESILFLPGTYVHSGSYLLASITTEGAFCDPPVGGSMVEALVEKGIYIDYEKEETEDDPEPIDIRQTLSLKLFPNPSNGRFTLETSGANYPLEIRVFNSMGAGVYGEMLTAPAKTLELYGLRQGIYIVKVLGPSGSVSRKLVIRY
ncbi:MAG TPA: T9SS type A sorting domain-containing protein, partial [Prolixibacteraceae bacterium]|nr:T9SS type A sorting domain-containing protein [Prolixibacteraceae bacterium]